MKCTRPRKRSIDGRSMKDPKGGHMSTPSKIRMWKAKTKTKRCHEERGGKWEGRFDERTIVKIDEMIQSPQNMFFSL